MTILHEWPLVFFTLTVQLAVGLHLALLAAMGPLRSGVPAGKANPWSNRPSLLVGLLMAVALTISLLHLGTPFNAVHTLSNLDDSWLSREILAALVFLGLWGLGFWLGSRPGVAPWKVRALAWAAAVAGIALVGAMAMIYMVPARPLWDHWLTAAGFFLTALLLGAVGVAAWAEHLSASGSASPVRVFLPGGAFLAAGLAAALGQVAVTLTHPVTVEMTASAAGGSSLATARLLLLLCGAVLLVVPLVRSSLPGGSPLRAEKPGRWAAAALLFLGASEVVGRMLFYAAGAVDSF